MKKRFCLAFPFFIMPMMCISLMACRATDPLEEKYPHYAEAIDRAGDAIEEATAVGLGYVLDE